MSGAVHIVVDMLQNSNKIGNCMTANIKLC